MTDDQLQDLIRSILEKPTAPFCEDAVRGEIKQQLGKCPHVKLEADAGGNLYAQYQRGSAAAPRFALVAHMDHPGYVGGEFAGWVPEKYREEKPPTRDFGAFAMWDLPACELRDGRIYSRACDDLVGCAAIVATLQELEEQSAEANVLALFTRAEEVGFVGAIEVAQSGRVSKDVTIISLECSSDKGGMATIGEGAILRVGDRTSIFDPATTATLAALAKKAGIPVQRRLMSGGTCEATAFRLYGFRCGALCVAMGNYHNCGPDERIEPECVSFDDVRALITLCVAIATSTDAPDVADGVLREKLEARAAENRARFERAYG
jgi:putative aminopeptidase FrvX